MKNPSFAYKKEVPQAERNYGMHPPLDMSSLAEESRMRSLSMNPPPLKQVYKQMTKLNQFGLELPRIDENPHKGFKGKAKAAPAVNQNQTFSEVDDSQFNLTGRQEPEQVRVLQSPPDYDPQNDTSAVDTSKLKKKKIKSGRAGGFRINIKDKSHRRNETNYNPNNNDLSVNYSKGDYAHLLAEIGVRNDPPSKKMIDRNTSSSMDPDTTLNSFQVLQGNKNTVRGLIDQMYQKEKKYTKQYFKEDYIQKNDFIFNLNKTHQLRLAKSKPNDSNISSPPGEPSNLGL